MKKAIVFIAACTFSFAAIAACATHTIMSNGRMTTCTTCCYGNNCTTNCF